MQIGFCTFTVKHILLKKTYCAGNVAKNLSLEAFLYDLQQEQLDQLPISTA